MLSLHLRNLSQNLFSVKFKLVCILNNQTKHWEFFLILFKKLCEETKEIGKVTKNVNVIAAFAEFISEFILCYI